LLNSNDFSSRKPFENISQTCFWFLGISFPFFGIFVHFILEYPIYISQSNHLYNFSFTAFSWSSKMPLEMKMVESVADLTAMNGSGNRMS